MQEQPQNSRLQKGDMKQVSCWRPKKVLGDTVNNPIAKAIWLTGIVILCLKDKNILNLCSYFFDIQRKVPRDIFL